MRGVAGRQPRRDARPRGDGEPARRHRAEGVQDPARPHRASSTRRRRGRSDEPWRAAADVHDARRRERFLEEVHSFEFWFQAVEGYLAGTTYGSPARDAPRSRCRRPSASGSITVLCNYCVGETAALEGASGLIAIAPEPPRQDLPRRRRSSTRAATSRCLLHRLRELGVADPELEIERRASRSLLAVQAPAARAGREQGLGGRDLRAERDPRVARVHGLPGPRRDADPVTREVLRGIVKDERRHIGFGENELGRRLATAPHIRARLGQIKKELDPLVLDALRGDARAARRCRAASRTELGRSYLESVERLGFADERRRSAAGAGRGRRRRATTARASASSSRTPASTRCRRSTGASTASGRAPATRSAPNEVICPVCKVVIRSTPRAAPGRPRLLHALHVAAGRGAERGLGPARGAGRVLKKHASGVIPRSPIRPRRHPASASSAGRGSAATDGRCAIERTVVRGGAGGASRRRVPPSPRRGPRSPRRGRASRVPGAGPRTSERRCCSRARELLLPVLGLVEAVRERAEVEAARSTSRMRSSREAVLGLGIRDRARAACRPAGRAAAAGSAAARRVGSSMRPCRRARCRRCARNSVVLPMPGRADDARRARRRRSRRSASWTSGRPSGRCEHDVARGAASSAVVGRSIWMRSVRASSRASTASRRRSVDEALDVGAPAARSPGRRSRTR